MTVTIQMWVRRAGVDVGLDVEGTWLSSRRAGFGSVIEDVRADPAAGAVHWDGVLTPEEAEQARELLAEEGARRLALADTDPPEPFEPDYDPEDAWTS